MSRVLVTVLRAGIVAAFALGLFAQIVVVPATAASEVDAFPPYAPLQVPYGTAAIAGVGCVQVALVAVWRLLTLAERDAIFTPRALWWVDTVIGALVVETVLALVVGGHLAVAEIPSPDDGMDVVGALGAALVTVGVGASFALLVVILRQLLQKAARLRTERAGAV
ncbi:hypothetical protein RKD26_003590 [Streptomyces calvus]|uniref:DUF2975 domain-containing protein n=1 Tax=Streptomyces calvus TaxID=67282 RepID=UPI003515A435